MDLPGTRAVVISPVAKGTPQEEAVAGDASYLILLAAIHKALKPRCYLEIGVGQGHSLALAKCPAIGVDPRPDVTVALGPQARVLRAAAGMPCCRATEITTAASASRAFSIWPAISSASVCAGRRFGR